MRKVWKICSHFTRTCEKCDVCVCVCVCVCVHTRTHMCWVMPDSATPWTVAPPGSSVHGILQIRILEWLPSSRGSSHPGIKSAYLASPGLSGRLFTTVAPGKPPKCSKDYLKDWLRHKWVSLGAERWDGKLATTTGDFEWCMKKDFSTDL